MDQVITAIVGLINQLVSDNVSPLYFDGIQLPSVTNTPHGVKRVYYGDPQTIARDDFPCIAIRPVATTIVSEGTRTDTKEHKVEIVIIENLKNYSETTPDDANKVQSLYTMMQMMEKAGNNMQTDVTSIVGMLLANPRLPYIDNGTKYAAVRVKQESVDYVFNSSRGFPTFEVIGLFTVTARGDRA
tara:strand:+ start:269 stop:826 length:558 start_codon:yes stop_codon:yes gene_type:complete